MSSSENNVSMESIDTLLKDIWRAVRGDRHAVSSSAKMSKVGAIREIMEKKFLNDEWLNTQEMNTGNLEVKPYVTAPLMLGTSIPHHVTNNVKHDVQYVSQYINQFLPKMLKFMHDISAAFPEPTTQDAGQEAPKVSKREIISSHYYETINVEPPLHQMLGNLQIDPNHHSTKMYYSTAIPVKYIRAMTKEEVKQAAKTILEVAEAIEHFDKGIEEMYKNLKKRDIKSSFIDRIWPEFDRTYGLLNHLWDEAKALNIWMSRSIKD